VAELVVFGSWIGMAVLGIGTIAVLMVVWKPK
jgi:hypothetical protein